MAKINTRAEILRVSVAVFLALGIASAGLISSFQSAAAASNANLWAVPVNSRIDDGNFQILRLNFHLDTGNPLDKIVITLDKGTSEEMVLEFNGNGVILTADPAFVFVDGSIKIKTDGYLLKLLKGKFKIAIDKTLLTVGEHDALAEIITTGETLTDDAHFRLRGGSTGQADLTPEFFFTWPNIPAGEMRRAWVFEENIGDGNAGMHMVSVYLSEDNILDGSDILVGDKEAKALKSGKDTLLVVKYELPEGTDSGQAYLILELDTEDDVNESFENNNVEARQINVI
ncbi:MAG: CARDB domain-containing protein [Nitrososphaera sp.]